MRVALRRFDNFLSTSQGLYTFSDDPQCLLRIQLTHAVHAVTIEKVRILKGDPVLAIHLWNEHMPQIPAVGADLAWALQIRRLVVHSFRILAGVMQNDELYKPVRALCGTSALFSFTGHTGGLRMIEHMGFTVLPYERPLGKFGEFWENLFAWALMWTYNAASLQSRDLLRLQRTEIWMDVAEFIQRYGKPTDPDR